MNERYLREKIAARSANADDYVELAGLLFESCRFEESIATLRQALSVPSDNITRASVLTMLAGYVYNATSSTAEPRALAEQAVRLTEGLETVEASVARAKAQHLVGAYVFPDDPASSRETAASALSILEPLLESAVISQPATRFEALMAAESLNSLLDRFDEASTQCREAFEAASNPIEKLYSLMELGTSYRQAGRLSEARNVFAEAVLYRDASPWALVRLYSELGWTERALGKHAEARAKFRKAIEILQEHPALPRDGLPELLRFYGELSYELEDMEEAARSYQSAADQYAATDPLHWNSLLWFAYSQRALGQNAAARENANLIKRSPIASGEDRANADVLLEAIPNDVSE